MVRQEIKKLNINLKRLGKHISFILLISIICVALLCYDEKTTNKSAPNGQLNKRFNKLEEQLETIIENQEKQSKKLQKMANKANEFYESHTNITVDKSEEITKKTRMRSSILEKGMEETLIQWVGESSIYSNWCLLYRASEHKFSISKFHEKCKNHAQTLTIIKSGNSVFGGFAPVPWNAKSEAGYVATTGSFLFSLKNPFNDPPAVFTAKNTEYAMFINSAYGPAFGSGQDLAIVSDGVFSNLGKAYNASPSRGNKALMGSEFSSYEDYEIFGRC